MRSTQSDMNMDFNGMGGTGVNRGANRFAKNMHTGHSNDGRLVNFPRGPVVGNKSDKVVPGTMPLAANAQGKDMFMGSSNPQVRQPGGTKAMPQCGKETFNFGRGPTKGNQ